MARSPYAPPSSPVGDPSAPPQLIPKPQQVRIAVVLLWLSLALALPSTYFEYRLAASTEDAVILTIIVVVVFSFAAYLNVQISKGRNWARWLCLAVVVLSGASYLLPENHPESLVDTWLTVAAFVLDGAALYLLFTRPAALWFRPQAGT